MDLWSIIQFGQPVWLLALLALPLMGLAARATLSSLPQRQLRLVLVVRSSILICLVLALSDIGILSPTHQTQFIIAVDRSLSVDPDEYLAARNWIESARTAVGDERIRWFNFAASPESPILSESFADAANNWSDEGDQSDQATAATEDNSDWVASTNLEQAIDVAVAATPVGSATHLVILSDGNETNGNVWNAAQNSNIRISTVPLQTRRGPELQLSSINVPDQVAPNAPYSIEVVVDAAQNDEVLIELFRGDMRIAAEKRVVRQGENRFLFTDRTDKTEKISARLTPDQSQQSERGRTSGDTLTDNNESVALVTVSTSPTVLLLDDDPQNANHLRRALAAEGIRLEVRAAAEIPRSMADLQSFDAVIIGNLPATAFSSRQMEMLRTYVSMAGGGLLMLGSEQTFGLGGYYRTTIEDLLPVRSDFEKENEQPGLGLILIIDRSGSMGGPKIELARQAARGAVDLLSQNDQIGVLAFDGTTSWISPLAPLTSAAEINERIDSIRADGGTTLYPAMREAFDALDAATARLKHVIILTDGYSTPGDFDDLTAQMASRRITVSTIGIGDADRELLEQIARIGGGRYYFTDTPDSIPQIFAKETITAGKSAISEDPFLPQLVRASPVVSGIDFEAAPFLLGYVATKPKPTSEVVLATETGEPLLSWWRYGLGVTAAFTADANGRWSSEWVTWNSFSRFWAQVIRHLIGSPTSLPVTVHVEQRHGQAVIEVEANTPSGELLSGADVDVRIIDPNLNTQEMLLQPAAPGLYRGHVSAEESGVWIMQLSVKMDGDILHEQTAGFVVGYPPELSLQSTNEALLSELAELTGGIFDPSPVELRDTQQDHTAVVLIPIRSWLLMTALILFVADVFLRRFELPWLQLKSEESLRRPG